MEISSLSLKAEMIKFWFPFQFHCKMKEKKGRDVFFQIVYPRNWCADICNADFLPSNLNFILKTVLLSNAILSFFLGMVYIFILQKIIAQRGRIHPFFYICCDFSQIFCTEVIQFFLLKIWDMMNATRVANINWWIFWMRNGGSLLTFFSPFYSTAALNL